MLRDAISALVILNAIGLAAYAFVTLPDLLYVMGAF